MSTRLESLPHRELVHHYIYLGGSRHNAYRIDRERLIGEILRLEREQNSDLSHQDQDKDKERGSLFDVGIQRSLHRIVKNMRPIVFKNNEEFYEASDVETFQETSDNIIHIDNNYLLFHEDNIVDDSYDLVELKHRNLSIEFVHVIYNGAEGDPAPEDLYVVVEIANYGLDRLTKYIEERIATKLPRHTRVIDGLGILQLKRAVVRIGDPSEILPSNVETEFSGAIALIVTVKFSIL